MSDSDHLPERESKSQRKKEMLDLQKLGELLVNLPSAQLAMVPLEPPLSDAIATARLIKAHEGKRRQLQYIGKLMRNVDVAPIQAAVSQIQRKDQLSKAKFHLVERWRDRLIAEEALEEFLGKFPEVDVQHLRQLIRNAKKQIKGADTALFRFLKEVLS